MPGRLLLDTAVVISALRGSGVDDMRALRRQGVEPWVCAITVEEIWRGVREGDEPAVRRMFRGLRLAPLGVIEGERAGAWRRSFAESGVILHQADCLIAAAAVGIGADLATANVKDFPMPELIVRRWAH